MICNYWLRGYCRAGPCQVVRMEKARLILDRKLNTANGTLFAIDHHLDLRFSTMCSQMKAFKSAFESIKKMQHASFLLCGPIRISFLPIGAANLD